MRRTERLVYSGQIYWLRPLRGNANIRGVGRMRRSLEVPGCFYHNLLFANA